jgi:hypothetical protein
MKKQSAFLLLVFIASISMAQINITTIPPTGLICAGDTIFMNATGCEIYNWEPGALFGPNVNATPTTTTTYTVYCLSAGNTSSTTVTIAVSPLPMITVIASTQNIAAGDSALLTTYGLPCSLYNWSPSTGLSSTGGDSVWASPTVTTTYTVTGCCPGGCPGSETVTINVINGISGNENETGIQVWQDNNNHIILQFTDQKLQKDATATLFDIRGKMLLQKPLVQSRTIIDISRFAKGSYILRMINHDKTFTKKIFKE